MSRMSSNHRIKRQIARQKGQQEPRHHHHQKRKGKPANMQDCRLKNVLQAMTKRRRVM